MAFLSFEEVLDGIDIKTVVTEEQNIIFVPQLFWLLSVSHLNMTELESSHSEEQLLRSKENRKTERKDWVLKTLVFEFYVFLKSRAIDLPNTNLTDLLMLTFLPMASLFQTEEIVS